MRRSIRIAQNSFAAEAASRTNVSDRTIRFWPSTLETVDAERKSKVTKQLDVLLDRTATTRGSQNKVLLATEVFQIIQDNMCVYAYHRRFLESQLAKSEELMEDCKEHEKNPNYTQEEQLRFLRLYEICKAHRILCKRILDIHHVLPAPPTAPFATRSAPVRRYPLRSNRGKK
jgi:hypothetical protein